MFVDTDIPETIRHLPWQANMVSVVPLTREEVTNCCVLSTPRGARMAHLLGDIHLCSSGYNLGRCVSDGPE